MAAVTVWVIGLVNKPFFKVGQFHHLEKRQILFKTSPPKAGNSEDIA